MIPLHVNKLVILDVETTDTSIADNTRTIANAIDIGAIVIDYEFNQLDSFSSLIRPPSLENVSLFTTELTGITKRDLDEAPRFEEVWIELNKFIGGQWMPLGAWGAPFDYRILSYEYLRHGIPWPHSYPFYDFLSMAVDRCNVYGIKPKSWSLKNVCERFQIKPEEEHRALSGAKKCLEVITELAYLDERWS